MSTNLQSVLADREYKNWLRAGLSLKYARQGILNLVKNDIDTFHQYVLTLLAGPHCNSCQIIKTRGVFSIRCPNSVCDKIFTAISNEHRFKPAWNNTDCQKWCYQAWQLAKCYMSVGYASKVSAADTDFPGLVNVIINNKRFNNLVKDDMTKTSNIFCQARDVRNTILHKANMRVTDTDLAVYIQTLQTMLSNPKCSTTDLEIQNALARLTEIQNGSLFVTTEDIDELKAEACRAIEEKKQEALSALTSKEGATIAAVKSQEGVTVAAVNQAGVAAESAVKVKQQIVEIGIKQTADETQKVIEGQTHKALADILSKTAIDVTAVNKVRVEAEDAIKHTAGAACRETQTVIDEKKHEVLSAVTSQEALSVRTVNKAGVEIVENAEMAIKKRTVAAEKVLDKKKQDILSVVTSQELSPVAAVNKARVEAIRDVNKARVEAIGDVNKARVKTVSAIQKQKQDAGMAGASGSRNNKISVKAMDASRTRVWKKIKKDKLFSNKKVLKDKKQDVLSVVTSQELSSVAAVNKAKVQAKSSIQKQKPKDSRMASSALQKHLISIYKEELSTPLSPVVQIDDLNIEELYVKPNMKLIDPKKEFKDKGSPINSYQDIFSDERKKEIYVLGDAGMGKTSLCKKLVSTWCQVHSKTIDNKSKDQLTMAKFDFLFYISLRDTVSINGVEEMIKHQLRLEKFQDQLPDVLENKKCLIILDGLDEWTTENTDARSSSINKGIPGRQGITNCRVLTTTRPSKFEAIQLKTTQIDTKIELLGIEKLSSEELIEIMIWYLNEKFYKQKTADECLKALRIKSLLSFMSIPVILKQLVCLWYFGKHIGTTKCVIYSQMFELYLDMAESRLNEDPEFKVKKEEWKNSKVQLPSCFDDNQRCQQFKPLIDALSNLSFETLVSDNQESSLVFNRSTVEFYGLTSADVNISLKIGILSQNKLMVDCISQMKKVSFLHKSYQEFLAALFVFNNQSDPEQFSKIFKRINKDFYLENVISFISGMCSSETTCMFVKSCGKLKQTTLENYLKEGWRCNHDNKHLQCGDIEIDTEHQPEPLELLCQANIHHMKALKIGSPPTARCLEYLLQVDTLEALFIGCSSSSSPSSPSSSSSFSCISEDNMYSLIHHNTHTLAWLSIGKMTLQSKTKLPTLLYNIQHLFRLMIYRTTMSQQLLDSLQEFKAQKTDIPVRIHETILPDIECTD